MHQTLLQGPDPDSVANTDALGNRQSLSSSFSLLPRHDMRTKVTICAPKSHYRRSTPQLKVKPTKEQHLRLMLSQLAVALNRDRLRRAISSPCPTFVNGMRKGGAFCFEIKATFLASQTSRRRFLFPRVCVHLRHSTVARSGSLGMMPTAGMPGARGQPHGCCLTPPPPPPPRAATEGSPGLCRGRPAPEPSLGHMLPVASCR